VIEETTLYIRKFLTGKTYSRKCVLYPDFFFGGGVDILLDFIEQQYQNNPIFGGDVCSKS
jgi:hypothetical protein